MAVLGSERIEEIKKLLHQPMGKMQKNHLRMNYDLIQDLLDTIDAKDKQLEHTKGIAAEAIWPGPWRE